MLPEAHCYDAARCHGFDDEGSNMWPQGIKGDVGGSVVAALQTFATGSGGSGLSSKSCLPM